MASAGSVTLRCLSHLSWIPDCGDSLTNGSTLVPTECNTPCPGNLAENCGGFNRLHVFWNGMGSTPPAIVQKVNEWEYVGSYR